MVKRKGFKKFVRSIEGLSQDIFRAKEYGIPITVWNKAGLDWSSSTSWLLNSFKWADTTQGREYWESIFINGHTEESKNIIRTWISEGYL